MLLVTSSCAMPPVESVAVPNQAGALSLRSLAQAQGFGIGSAVTLKGLRKDERYRQVLVREFTQIMAFSLQRFMENGGKPSFLLADAVESVEATGDLELTVKLKQPFSAFTALLAFTGTCAVSPQAYERGSGKFNPNQFVGTGPYKLAALKSDSVRLDAFADYWGEKPKNEGVDIQIYGDNSANLFNAFRTQAVDIAYQSLDPGQIQNLVEGAQKGQWLAIEAPGTAVNFMKLSRRASPTRFLPWMRSREAIGEIEGTLVLVFAGTGAAIVNEISNGSLTQSRCQLCLWGA